MDHIPIITLATTSTFAETHRKENEIRLFLDRHPIDAIDAIDAIDFIDAVLFFSTSSGG